MMDVTGKSGVPGKKDCGKELIGLCIERKFMVGNTWFKKKDINKYTWERVRMWFVTDRVLLNYLLIFKKC